MIVCSACPLLGSLSSFGVSFIGGFTVSVCVNTIEVKVHAGQAKGPCIKSSCTDYLGF